jgi:hypothetical protein
MQGGYAAGTIVVDIDPKVWMRKKEGLVQAHAVCRSSHAWFSATSLAAQQDREIAAARMRGALKCAEAFSFRKEVIQPQVLLRLPCYDFTPIMNYTLGGCSLAVSSPTSSATHFRDVTGGVYKARERIHRGMLIHDY